MENEVKVETKKKGNGLFTLFACVMTGVIVFLGTNLGQKIADNNDKGGSTKNSNVTSNVESNTTSNVVDTTVTDTEKSYINDKMSFLFSGNEIKNNLIVVNGISQDTILSGLSDDFKTKIILASFLNSNSVLKYDKKNGTFKDNITKETVLGQAEKYIDGNVFTERYKKVFGTNPSYIDIKGCPSYFYDSTNKAYTIVYDCGSASTVSQMAYIDSYSKTNTSIIVTTYVGSYEKTENIITYNDYYKSNGTMTNSTILNTGSTAVVINAENKTKFTKYNFVFGKSADGQYYFNSVTKSN